MGEQLPIIKADANLSEDQSPLDAAETLAECLLMLDPPLTPAVEEPLKRLLVLDRPSS